MNNLELQIDLVKILERYQIVFGVFQEDNYKEFKINILNTDDSIDEKILTLHDIMYFTEYGTLTIPPKNILSKSLLKINLQLSQVIDKILNNIFINGCSEIDIDTKMKEFELECNTIIQNTIIDIANNENFLSNLLGQTPTNVNIINPVELKKYIKCKIIKK